MSMGLDLKENQDKNTRQIQNELVILTDSISNLDKSLANLGERLCIVCLGENPKGPDSVEGSSQHLVPLANEIRTQSNRINSLYYFVEDILDRLEL